MPNKQKRRDEPSPAPSEEVLLATAQNKYTSLMTWRWVAIVLSSSVPLLAATPLATVIAGTNTSFNVNISLAANVALAITTGAGYGYGARQRRRAKHLETRNNTLNQRVERSQKEVEGLQKQLEGFKELGQNRGRQTAGP